MSWPNACFRENRCQGLNRPWISNLIKGFNSEQPRDPGGLLALVPSIWRMGRIPIAVIVFLYHKSWEIARNHTNEPLYRWGTDLYKCVASSTSNSGVEKGLAKRFYKGSITALPQRLGWLF